MIKNNQKYLNTIHILLDVLILTMSYLLALYLSFGSALENLLSTKSYIKVMIALIPLYLILYRGFHLYNSKRLMASVDIIKNIIISNVIGIMALSVFLYFFRKYGDVAHFSLRVIVWFFVLNVLFLTVERIGIKKSLALVRKKGFNQKHMLLVGFSDASDRLIDAIKRNPEWGYAIDGILDDLSEIGTTYRHTEVTGRIDKLEEVLQTQDIDEVAITLPLAAYNKLGDIVNTCEKYGVHTKFIPDYTEIISSNPVTGDMDGVAVVNIRNVPLTDPLNRVLKRAMDIICSIIFIILFSPIMIVAAIAVKVSSPGPILFKQKRVGFHNKEFNMYKFRSMVQQRPEDEKKGWTTKGDARVTKVGGFLRKTSIDELPQFFNVLFGSMSIVGPRPERKQFVEQFMEEIPRYNVKHQVRPGITGWAQVNGLRGDTSIPERIKYDLYYIENWTLWLDIKIMFLTVFKGFINKNAY